MKKIYIAVICFFLLTSCFWAKDESIDTAKQELLSQTQTGIELPQTQTGWEIETTLSAQKKVAITYLDEKGYITIDPIDESSINFEEITIRGKAQSGWVDAITVQFSNGESSYPLDSYTLKNYVLWASTFEYHASARQKVLDFWKNEYLFTAKFWEDSSQVKVEIYLDKNEASRTAALQATWSGEIVWEPTNIAGLSLQKMELSPLDCSATDGITEFLLTKYSWAYWNTCRDVVKERSIVFNVLRLEADTYLYERHYYDFVWGQYGILTLETWTWVDKANMGDKNKELKEKDFSGKSSEADMYFKKLP